MTSAHRRYLAIETAIGAAINGVLSLLFCVLIFGGSPMVPVRGTHGLIVDGAPQSFMVALMSVLVPTLLTRSRMRSGRVTALPGRRLPGPRQAPMRAVLVAVSVALLAVALQAVLLPLGPSAWPFGTVLVAKIAYGALLGAALTSLAVRFALRDG